MCMWYLADAARVLLMVLSASRVLIRLRRSCCDFLLPETLQDFVSAYVLIGGYSRLINEDRRFKEFVYHHVLLPSLPFYMIYYFPTGPTRSSNSRRRENPILSSGEGWSPPPVGEGVTKWITKDCRLYFRVFGVD